MSLTTIVTVHCDEPGCGHWVYTADHPARVRRKRGWVTRFDESGFRSDKCPRHPRPAASEETP